MRALAQTAADGAHEKSREFVLFGLFGEDTMARMTWEYHNRSM